MATELATMAAVDNTALTSHRAATNAAGLCRAAVEKSAVKIQGRPHITIEGWQTIANSFGCVASARDCHRVDGGYVATGEIRRVADGVTIATAEGFLGDDETTWSKRPEFARRAMAQTRAMSRAARSAFAFVVLLMENDICTTPAEEMMGVVDHAPPAEPVAVRPAKNTSFEKARAAIAGAKTIEELQSISDRVSAAVAAGRIDEVERELLVTELGEREGFFFEAATTGGE